MGRLPLLAQLPKGGDPGRCDSALSNSATPDPRPYPDNRWNRYPAASREHADEIRRRRLMALEEADQTRDPSQRAFLQTVVVVVAGGAGRGGGGVARDRLARLWGQTIQPFRWLDLGSMAVIGPWYAVADLRGLHFTGLVGWMVWALAHLAFIPDTENRIALFSKWMWQIAIRQRTALLITGRPDHPIGVDVGLFRAPRPTV